MSDSTLNQETITSDAFLEWQKLPSRLGTYHGNWEAWHQAIAWERDRLTRSEIPVIMAFPVEACISEMEENYQAYMSDGAVVSASVMKLCKGIVRHHATQPVRESVSLLKKSNTLPDGCYCQPGKCAAPKAAWCRDTKKRDSIESGAQE